MSIAPLTEVLDLGRFLGLPPSFSEVFSSQRVAVGADYLHVVRGGEGPPVLLIPGWPQSWYAWRGVMLALAAAGRHVVAIDPKGMGDSDAPTPAEPGEGYDTGAVAGELVAVMERLGLGRFDVAGHDVGMWIAYALAADHPDRVGRVALVDAIIPGLGDGPLLLGPATRNARLWHFAFNRAPWEVQKPLLEGAGARAYVAWQFRTKAASPTTIPAEAVAVYQDACAGERMRGGLEHYRAIDDTMRQNRQRVRFPLRMPVLAIGGELGVGDGVGAVRSAVHDLEVVVLPGIGHYVPEEAADDLARLLVSFFSGDPASARAA